MLPYSETTLPAHLPSSQTQSRHMYSTRGIEAIATVTELRSKTSELITRAQELETGIMIQKNNEPSAVLLSYDLYMKLFEHYRKSSKK